jgi:hypothetical protein
LCTFLAGGPAIAIVQQALDYFPPQFNPDVPDSIGKVAYFYSAFALLQVIPANSRLSPGCRHLLLDALG